jgi:hypothetical protein
MVLTRESNLDHREDIGRDDRVRKSAVAGGEDDGKDKHGEAAEEKNRVVGHQGNQDADEDGREICVTKKLR